MYGVARVAGRSGWPKSRETAHKRAKPRGKHAARLTALRRAGCLPAGASPLSTLLTNRLRVARGRRFFRITGLPHWTRNKHAART
ncbi:hypothetical protein A8H39_23410 [Paraburkholderia fungorum]|nr:hypothetical protein A8H39_23410 [Paraburkholderia fungorum]PZR38494.1 MAG: hypothetical protein DI523_38250 [Paraburkholderia fungorum]QLD48575.1 hypothetical protein C9419_05765 [Paraburkholderia fungorum]